MLKTRPAKEVVIRMPNAIGTLDKIARTIADKGINILAVSAWVEGADAVIRIVTDDSVRVLDALRGQKYNAREDPATFVRRLNSLTLALAGGGASRIWIPGR